MSELRVAGCNALRSHIDWGDEAAAPIAWTLLNELAQHTHDLTEQTATLTGIDQIADRVFCDEAAGQVASLEGGVLGAFVLHHDA